jgi:hypothetical protein
MLQQNGVSKMMVSRSSRSYYRFLLFLTSSTLNKLFYQCLLAGGEKVAKAGIFLYFWGAAMTSFPFFFTRLHFSDCC